jgi:site-specific recombinase XerD
MATDSLKLNDGTSDDREKVVFHSLRHTFCSWLVGEGVDLYTVKEFAGHKTLAMTARYSQLANGILQNAIGNLQDGVQRARTQPKNSHGSS